MTSSPRLARGSASIHWCGNAAWPLGPHGYCTGDFYRFGDVELLAKAGPAAEQIHFGPWRGVGAPAQAPR